jgi:hypothetical protein
MTMVTTQPDKRHAIRARYTAFVYNILQCMTAMTFHYRMNGADINIMTGFLFYPGSHLLNSLMGFNSANSDTEDIHS